MAEYLVKFRSGRAMRIRANSKEEARLQARGQSRSDETITSISGSNQDRYDGYVARRHNGSAPEDAAYAAGISKATMQKYEKRMQGN